MRTIEVALRERSYPIHVGPGVRQRLGEVIGRLGRVHQVAVLADGHVAKLHLEKLLAALGRTPTVIAVPPGEQSKSLLSASYVYDRLAKARLERDDLLVTLGGGVVGDLGGFVAATWLRGIRFVQVPTSMQAALDASVGGKTGVNHPAGKNLIGAFHQPSAVLIDTELLATLPQRDHVAGLAESVKHAAIGQVAFLDWQQTHARAILSRQPQALSELIARNCALKADVVARDERETGLRAVLNYGHTAGHALEHLLEYYLRHGECVGLGMLVANQIACARGLLARPDAERVAGLLASYGLPRRLPRAVAPAAVLEVCRMDKKVRSGAIHFVLLRALGAAERVPDVRDDEIAAALETIQPR